jgi:hypothetical protein
MFRVEKKLFKTVLNNCVKAAKMRCTRVLQVYMQKNGNKFIE